MADEEHVALLKQGVEVWNRWREENPNIWPNLTGAELSDVNLLYEKLAVKPVGAKLGTNLV
jgi:hypothetical protein